LKESTIPDRKWFYNRLNSTQIDEQIYLSIKNKYSTVYELLEDYNNQDVVPAIQATKKLVKFFKDIDLDVHKDGISISGLSLKYLWKVKDEEAEFRLFKGNEELYHKYRSNLVGGPSIVFNHYQERDKTKIRDVKSCKSIQGFDANSLYSYCLAQDMLVGDHNIIEPYPSIIEDILNDNFFGIIECDINVPDNLKEHFKDFLPIFKNTDIKYEDLSEETKEQVKPSYNSRKLIGSYFGTKMLFISELVKWYVKHGLVVSNITLAFRYEKKRPFKRFVDQISQARRKGDISKDYKLIGEINKLIGNSCYGKTLQNFTKYEAVSIVSEDKLVKNLKSVNYKTHSDLHKGYEFRFKKSKHKQDIPVQIGFTVYQLAKLRMLEFYYDCIDFYLDRSDYQAIQMDTDSMYLALSDTSFDKLVKPELMVEYQAKKQTWFGRKDTVENEMFDRRTPGLFKMEYSGTGIIALSSKMYYAFGETDKMSSKGLNKKQNDLTKERYLAALHGDSAQVFKNRGFRVKDNKMTTYSMNKYGMRIFNDKLKRVGFNTFPIDL
jgi:hypothetical protein